MVNASFVFGMDDDDETVFDRTVDWAVRQGIETATFHILTPYPGTGLHTRLASQGRITSSNWDLYDTRHVVYRPARLTPQSLEAGYHWAYREFYRWSSIARAARAHDSWKHQVKHFAYSAGWKKFERAWNLVIRMRQLRQMTPILEAVLAKVTRVAAGEAQSVADTVARRLPGAQAGDEPADVLAVLPVRRAESPLELRFLDNRDEHRIDDQKEQRPLSMRP
jgi:hypothetical protein